MTSCDSISWLAAIVWSPKWKGGGEACAKTDTGPGAKTYTGLGKVVHGAGEKRRSAPHFASFGTAQSATAVHGRGHDLDAVSMSDGVTITFDGYRVGGLLVRDCTNDLWKGSDGHRQDPPRSSRRHCVSNCQGGLHGHGHDRQNTVATGQLAHATRGTSITRSPTRRAATKASRTNIPHSGRQ